MSSEYGSMMCDGRGHIEKPSCACREIKYNALLNEVERLLKSAAYTEGHPERWFEVRGSFIEPIRKAYKELRP